LLTEGQDGQIIIWSKILALFNCDLTRLTYLNILIFGNLIHFRLKNDKDLYYSLITIGMNYILCAAMTSILVAVGLTNIPFQPASAQDDLLINICKMHPEVCEGVTLPWWMWIFCPGCPEGLNLGLKDILTIPDNQSFSVGVQHGPTSDTIMIEIPKALSSSILNQTASGPTPDPWIGSGQNQAVQSN
jgi:hypothetical protein